MVGVEGIAKVLLLNAYTAGVAVTLAQLLPVAYFIDLQIDMLILLSLMLFIYGSAMVYTSPPDSVSSRLTLTHH